MIPGRFVGEHELGLQDESSRYRGTVLLPPDALVRQAVCPPVKVEGTHGTLGAFLEAGRSEQQSMTAGAAGSSPPLSTQS